jgi:stage II sporulation protein AB (anti-sigma F factor)
MKVEFLNKSTNEGFARVVVAAFVSQLDPTVEDLADIKTAVSEAVTNAIIHGYENKIGYVSIEGELGDNYVRLIIEDKGKGIEDLEKARQPLFTSQPHMERSGMGFTVMETFMDNVEVETNIGKGTKIIMTKYFNNGK